MAPAIGSLSFDTMRGTLAPGSERVTPLDRPGQDGRGYREDGTKPVPCEFRTVKYEATAALAQTHAAACSALIGQASNLTDGRAQTHTHCFVVDAVPRILPCIQAGSAKFCIVTRWVLENYQV